MILDSQKVAHGPPALSRSASLRTSTNAREQVLDVPPELAARVRLLQAGDTSKNDPDDARPVAVAALRSTARRPVLAEDHAAVLKVWAKRHRDLARARNQAPAGCMRCSATWSLAVTRRRSPRPRPPASSSVSAHPARLPRAAAVELAAGFLAGIRRLDAQLRDTSKKPAAAVRAPGTGLTGLFGVGPVIAGTVIGDVRQVFRFPTRDHFAAYNGTAPVEVSSGGRKICRLSLRGNRRLNHAIHMAAITQIRHTAQPGAGLLREETGGGQDAQGGAAGAQAADQRCDLRGAGGRRPAGRCRLPKEPGRATGEPLCLQGE